jgi:hypothetical protein
MAPADVRKLLVERLADKVTSDPEKDSEVTTVPGTDYVAVHLGDNIALARPLTDEERATHTPDDKSAYFVADVLPDSKIKR